MRYYVIIAAGGSGKRMNADIPKQFLVIADKPIIVHTIEKFAKALPKAQFIISIHPDWNNKWQSIRETFLTQINIITVNGGAERFHSVKNALNKIPDDGIICIHDAARPLVNEELIKRCVQECEINGTAIPSISVQESLRFITYGNNVAVNRNDYRLIQTPQCFKSTILQQAYQQEFDSQFTDDASVVESAGFNVHLTEGDRMNIKITTQIEFDLINLWMQNKD